MLMVAVPRSGEPRVRSLWEEIANLLLIGDETVKTHVTNVLGKLQAENRAQAVAHALKRGLVTLEELE